MQSDIPLHPARTEARRQSPFRLGFTVLGLMLVVAIAGVLLSIETEAIRLHNLGSYHAIKTMEAGNSRPPGPPFGLTPAEEAHYRMSKEYHDLANLKEVILVSASIALASLALASGVGRVVIHLSRRRRSRS